MRTTWGIAGLAALAIGTLGIAGGGTPATAAATSDTGRAALGTAAVEALLAHPGAALAGDGTDFTVTDTVVDDDGATHVRLDRTYDGLRVVGGDLVVHRGAADGWRGVSQTLDTTLDLATTPAVGADAASTKTLAPARATADIAKLRTSGTPELVVDALGATPRLAWEVTTRGQQADGTPSRLSTYVDARTGKVIRRVEGIHTADGSGQSLYSGTVPISITGSGSSYTLTDAAHGNAKTTDMQNKEDSLLCQIFGAGCSNGVVYTSTDTSFGTGSNANRESAAVDAHYGGAVTFDYFKNVHGRNGIFGNGTGAPSRVHYGSGYVNAFWDGSKMTYGDGDGTEFGPLVSLDVAGHEMSHGVTENTAGLTYSGESGGLNEATSDIFGTMVEFYAANANDPGDYLIGEEFDLASHLGFRRMDDPDSDGSSQNCWTTGTKDLDVHYSSGVGNHFFYLLAEGTGSKTIGGVTHTSTACNGATLTGIGKDAAAAIWFRALDVYMTSGTTYAQARTATLSAATDLYGASSTQRAAVAAAWSGVNVS